VTENFGQSSQPYFFAIPDRYFLNTNQYFTHWTKFLVELRTY